MPSERCPYLSGHKAEAAVAMTLVLGRSGQGHFIWPQTTWFRALVCPQPGPWQPAVPHRERTAECPVSSRPVLRLSPRGVFDFPGTPAPGLTPR